MSESATALPRFSLLLEDSEVAAVQATPEGVRIAFAAAHALRHDAADGGRPLAGYLRGVTLLLTGARLPEADEAWFGRIAQARVEAAGGTLSRLPLPGTLAGPLRLELVLGGRSPLLLQATALACHGGHEADFRESLAC